MASPPIMFGCGRHTFQIEPAKTMGIHRKGSLGGRGNGSPHANMHMNEGKAAVRCHEFEWRSFTQIGKARSGVLDPFKIEKSLNGTPWTTITIQNVAFQTGLSDNNFPITSWKAVKP